MEKNELFKKSLSQTMGIPIVDGPNEKCDYTIIGGGISGVHTAYRLLKSGKGNICVIECFYQTNL